jgi:hypothetical protein
MFRRAAEIFTKRRVVSTGKMMFRESADRFNRQKMPGIRPRQGQSVPDEGGCPAFLYFLPA